MQPAQIAQVAKIGDRLNPVFEPLRALPAPMFDVTIGKREVRAAIVPVRRQIDPNIAIRTVGRLDPKGRINNVIFMNIDEDEQLARRRIKNVKIFGIGSRGSGIAVDGTTHIIAARVEDALSSGRFVRGAVINGGRLIVRKQKPLFDIHGRRVDTDVAGAPGISEHDGHGVGGVGHVDEVVGRQSVIVIIEI